jgi:hypothetical protein
MFKGKGLIVGFIGGLCTVALCVMLLSVNYDLNKAKNQGMSSQALAEIPYTGGTLTNTGPGGDYYTVPYTIIFANNATNTYSLPRGTFIVKIPQTGGNNVVLQFNNTTGNNASWSTYAAQNSNTFLFNDGCTFLSGNAMAITGANSGGVINAGLSTVCNAVNGTFQLVNTGNTAMNATLIRMK